MLLKLFSIVNWIKSIGVEAVMTEELCLALLASAELPWEAGRILWERYSSAIEIYQSYTDDSAAFLSVLPPHCQQMIKKKNADMNAAQLESVMKEHHIHAISIKNPLYPPSLKNIADAPWILFYQGNTDLLNSQHSIAVVGSRNASYHGLEATKRLTKRLAEFGVCIVSGLAYGIDTAAHAGCLDGRGYTISVSGCGLDQIYPASNAVLKEKILKEGGLFISEYPPMTKPLAWHFPVRNRIISGLSNAVILMEAQIKSGSMTTVQHALNQGKEVFVYPGEADSYRYEGNHQLLREGARFFTRAEDILEDMNWLDKSQNVGQNNQEFCLPEGKTHEENAVIQALSKGSLSFEQLAGITGISSAALLGTLTIMQLNGMIEALPGKTYRLKM